MIRIMAAPAAPWQTASVVTRATLARFLAGLLLAAAAQAQPGVHASVVKRWPHSDRVESNGMVLAGSHDGKAVLCSFEAEIAPGSKVR